FVLSVVCLVAAAYSLPAPAPARLAAAPPAPVSAEKDALEPKDDLKTDSTYGLGYATYPLGYYGAYPYSYPSYGYGLSYSYSEYQFYIVF
ncbi:unnamed protein product, partial [Nesidiocoris tenuis]